MSGTRTVLLLCCLQYFATVLGALPGGQGVQQAPDNVNWLDAAPGVAMEYKVHVDAAKEDCYWQYVHPGATFYVSAQGSILQNCFGGNFAR
jgi:hypothetical protein